jgi:hypothetical protein
MEDCKLTSREIIEMMINKIFYYIKMYEVIHIQGEEIWYFRSNY